MISFLCQPIEDKVVTISRTQGSLTFPANFMLVAAINPCPCGYYGDPIKPCACAPSTVTKYQKRISGSLLDHIDIHIKVPRVDYQKLSSDRLGESSEAIRKRVQAARDRQTARFTNLDSKKTKHESMNVISNADMRVAEIRQFCKLDDSGESSDPCRDGSDESISPRLSSRVEVGVHDCRPRRMRSNSSRAFGGGTTVQTESSLVMVIMYHT